MTRRAAVVAALAVVALLAACADDGDSGHGAQDDRGAGAPTSQPPTPTTSQTSSPPTTAPPAFTGDPDSAFCQRLRAADLGDPVGDGTGTPAGIQAELRRFLGELRDLRAVAPEEVADDVAALEDGLRRLDAILAEVGYDFDVLAATGSLADAVAVATDPAFEASGARLEAYRTQVCDL